jgi:uncharacterized membrane-anchored protein
MSSVPAATQTFAVAARNKAASLANAVGTEPLSKVPQVTLGFWIIKILATTLGETGGDALSMTLKLSYAVSTVIFLAIFIAVVSAEIKAKHFHPFLYWTVIVATTTAGTTLADFCDRSLGIGYLGGSLLLLGLLLLSLAIWRIKVGHVSFNLITTPQVETFYWLTIFTSNTLGTALGDWLADSAGFGYERGAMVFAGGLLLLALLFFFTKVSRTFLFWAAFILTRPLGATLGDMLTKPHDHGGLALDRILASLVLAAVMVGCILLFPQQPGSHSGHNAHSA